MASGLTKRWMIRGGVLLAVALGACFAACTGEGPPRPTCEDVAGFDAGVDDIVPYTEVLSDAQPPEAFGQEPDPGPQCTDCTQDRDLEIMTVVDFENGFAPAWFNYGESGILLEPPPAGNAEDDAGVEYTLPPPYWGLQVASLAEVPGGPRCGSQHALHMAGGRFSSWGGAAVTRLVVVRDEFIDVYCLEGEAESNAASLAARDAGVHGIGAAPRYMTGDSVMKDQANGCFFFISPAAEQPSRLGIDVSEYDGISFWARRGPSGQSTLRVGLVDDNTSDDRALQIERKYWEEIKAGDPDAVVDPNKAGAPCHRVLECCRHCYENLEYQEYVSAARSGYPYADVRTTVANRCWVQGEILPEFRVIPTISEDGEEGQIVKGWDFRSPNCGPVPTTEDLNDTCWSTDEEVWNTWNRDYKLCCPRTMEQEQMDDYEKNGDPRYGGKPCLPYVFNFDHSSGSYCYEPGEILPEKNQNRCGETFERSVIVGPEWKLYTVPWEELRRFTPDKPPLNPSIWQLGFYFSAGYLDTYIDDVGFYRRRRER